MWDDVTGYIADREPAPITVVHDLKPADFHFLALKDFKWKYLWYISQDIGGLIGVRSYGKTIFLNVWHFKAAFQKPFYLKIWMLMVGHQFSDVSLTEILITDAFLVPNRVGLRRTSMWDGRWVKQY